MSRAIAATVALLAMLLTWPAKAASRKLVHACIPATASRTIDRCTSLRHRLTEQGGRLRAGRLNAADSAELMRLHTDACGTASGAHAPPLLRRAALLSKAGWHELAAAALRQLAIAPMAQTSVDAKARARKQLGHDAVAPYLQALRSLALDTRRDRSACWSLMQADVERFERHYCPHLTAGASTSCRIVWRTRADIRRLEVEQAVRAADNRDDRAKARAAYLPIARDYLAIWERYGRAACAHDAKNRPARPSAGPWRTWRESPLLKPLCYQQEEILYNANRAFIASGHRIEAIEPLRLIMDRRYGLDRSHLAPRVTIELARLYVMAGAYERAAHWFEQHQQRWPRSQEARTTLKDAAIMRMAAGDLPAASRLVRRFKTRFGRQAPRLTADLQAALSAAKARASR